MLREDDITIEIKSQQYVCKSYTRNLGGTESALQFESRQQTQEVSCPYCGGKVNISGYTTKHLKDIPIWTGVSKEQSFVCHRYRCTECGRKFTEDIPLRSPGTRITERAAEWVRTLARNGMTIRAIQQVTGIHWDMIRKLQATMMTETLEEGKQQLSKRTPRIISWSRKTT